MWRRKKDNAVCVQGSKLDLKKMDLRKLEFEDGFEGWQISCLPIADAEQGKIGEKVE